jgi:hypothetical protein
MFQGRARQSRETARLAVQFAQAQGLKNDAARILSNFGAWNALLGDCKMSRVETAEALSAVKGADPEPRAVLGPSLCGDSTQTRSIKDELVRRWPLSTEINANWGPISGAAIEINRGNTAESIRLLQKANPYEMGYIAGFWPTYIRANAYLRHGSAGEAMAEFQKIIDRRGVWPAAVHYPLAHLGLARAADLAGDTAKSRRAYEDFFALWKDADHDIPILLEAQREYDKLAR